MKPYTRPSFWCTIVTEHLPGFCRLKYRYGKDEYMKEMTQDSLDLFTQPTASWFRQAFGQPTKVQQEAWPAIKAGGPVLISAPTGIGKTLSDLHARSLWTFVGCPKACRNRKNIIRFSGIYRPSAGTGKRGGD